MKTLLRCSVLSCVLLLSSIAGAQPYAQIAANNYFAQEPVADSQPAATATGCDSFSGGGCASNCAPGCGDCCRYFSLFGGWVEADSSRLESTAAPGAGPGIELEYNTGWLLGGAVGRRLNCRWRFELEGAYRNHSFDEAVDAAGGTTPVDGRGSVYSGMANIYRDFGGVNACRRWQPYVGAGAGFAFVNANPTIQGATFNVDDSAFAAQGIAGITWHASACTQWFTEYRVFGTDDLTVGSVSVPQTAPAPAGLSTDYLSHNFVFGVRFCR